MRSQLPPPQGTEEVVRSSERGERESPKRGRVPARPHPSEEKGPSWPSASWSLRPAKRKPALTPLRCPEDTVEPSSPGEPRCPGTEDRGSPQASAQHPAGSWPQEGTMGIVGFWVQILLAPVSSVVRQAVSSSATEKQQEPPACGENSVRLEIPSAKCHAW